MKKQDSRSARRAAARRGGRGRLAVFGSLGLGFLLALPIGIHTLNSAGAAQGPVMEGTLEAFRVSQGDSVVLTSQQAVVEFSGKRGTDFKHLEFADSDVSASFSDKEIKILNTKPNAGLLTIDDSPERVASYAELLGLDAGRLSIGTIGADGELESPGEDESSDFMPYVTLNLTDFVPEDEPFETLSQVLLSVDSLLSEVNVISGNPTTSNEINNLMLTVKSPALDEISTEVRKSVDELTSELERSVGEDGLLRASVSELVIGDPVEIAGSFYRPNLNDSRFYLSGLESGQESLNALLQDLILVDENDAIHIDFGKGEIRVDIQKLGVTTSNKTKTETELLTPELVAAIGSTVETLLGGSAPNALPQVLHRAISRQLLDPTLVHMVLAVEKSDSIDSGSWSSAGEFLVQANVAEVAMIGASHVSKDNILEAADLASGSDYASALAEAFAGLVEPAFAQLSSSINVLTLEYLKPGAAREAAASLPHAVSAFLNNQLSIKLDVTTANESGVGRVITFSALSVVVSDSQQQNDVVFGFGLISLFKPATGDNGPGITGGDGENQLERSVSESPQSGSRAAVKTEPESSVGSRRGDITHTDTQDIDGVGLQELKLEFEQFVKRLSFDTDDFDFDSSLVAN